MNRKPIFGTGMAILSTKLCFLDSNASANFQGYINKFFAEKLDVFIIMYLNNISIYIEDPD